MNNHVRIKNDASRNAADNNQQDDINCLLITYIYLIGRIDLSRRKKSIDFINKDHSTAIQNKRKQHKKSDGTDNHQVIMTHQICSVDARYSVNRLFKHVNRPTS